MPVTQPASVTDEELRMWAVGVLMEHFDDVDSLLDDAEMLVRFVRGQSREMAS